MFHDTYCHVRVTFWNSILVAPKLRWWRHFFFLVSLRTGNLQQTAVHFFKNGFYGQYLVSLWSHIRYWNVKKDFRTYHVGKHRTTKEAAIWFFIFYWFFFSVSLSAHFLPFNPLPSSSCSQFTQEILPFSTSHVD